MGCYGKWVACAHCQERFGSPCRINSLAVGSRYLRQGSFFLSGEWTQGMLLGRGHGSSSSFAPLSSFPLILSPLRLDGKVNCGVTHLEPIRITLQREKRGMDSFTDEEQGVFCHCG